MVEPTQRVGVSLGEGLNCAPNLDSKYLFPTKVLGIQGCIKVHDSLDVPPSDVFGVGLRHKGCIYHHLRPSGLWIYWRIKSIGLAQSLIEFRG